MLPDVKQEKTLLKEDNLQILLDLNGGVCEVFTGFVIGMTLSHLSFLPSELLSFKKKRSIDERPLVYFADTHTTTHTIAIAKHQHHYHLQYQLIFKPPRTRPRSFLKMATSITSTCHKPPSTRQNGDSSTNDSSMSHRG
jgi:hypothetical protein